MQTVGIIQPGRLGDIIMLLPIAKYYSNKGYKVVWPMFNHIADMVREVVDYVDIKNVSSNVYTCVDEAKQIFKQNNITNILDLAATFPDSNITDDYVKECNDGFGEEPVDQFKYRKAKVPFDEKWNLAISRNFKEEDNLYKKYVLKEDYVVTCLTHSKGSVDIKFDAGDCQIIKMNEDHNIFFWLKILENTKCFLCVESSVSNLVDQLKLDIRKFIVTKPGDGRTPPIRRSNWKVL